MTHRYINPTQTPAWQSLQQLAPAMQQQHLREFFAHDAQRFERFSCQQTGMLLDYSKQKVNEAVMQQLLALSKQTGLKEGMQAMRQGVVLNETEQRAVLHTVLRDNQDKTTQPQLHQAVTHTLQRMRSITEAILSGEWRSSTGEAITDVINIGVGGSDLGAQTAMEALSPYKTHLNIHFLSNVDGQHLADLFNRLNPATTLFVVVSKSFTTDETMTNAQAAKQWLQEHLTHGGQFLDAHCIAVSSEADKVAQFGLSESNRLDMWDWVGGRFSLWSAVGLCIALGLGFDHFETLLAGAEQMDAHFFNADFSENLPVLMALLGIWNHNFLQQHSLAVVPYAQGLHRFIAHLQQLDMESNGKSTDRNGNMVNYRTGPVLWGDVGTNGQHAFHQLLHQGQEHCAVEFIAFRRGHADYPVHHHKLLANCLAQSRALAFGRNESETRHWLAQQGGDWQSRLPFQVFDGDRPNSTLLLDQLTPFHLGQLIALYEHKVFVQGWIWNVFSFDQWGVELGKTLAKQIEPALAAPLGEDIRNEHLDVSTQGLMHAIRYWPI